MDLREPVDWKQQISQKTDLVNEVESHCPLANPHLLGLPILTVLGPNLVHTLVESPGRLILLPIFLSLTTIHININQSCDIYKSNAELNLPRFYPYLQSGGSIQHDVFGASLDVFIPASKPWDLQQTVKTWPEEHTLTTAPIPHRESSPSLTLLSWRTSFHLCPGGGLGILAVL